MGMCVVYAVPFRQWNSTKALAHVARVRNMHVSLCAGRIDPKYQIRYDNLLYLNKKKKQMKE